MRFNRTPILSLTVVALLALSLTACGGKKDADTGKEPAGNTSDALKNVDPNCRAAIFATDEVNIMDTTTRLYLLQSPKGSANCADYYRALGDSLSQGQNSKTLTFVYFLREPFETQAVALTFPKPKLRQHFVAYYAKLGGKPAVVKTDVNQVPELR